jgi:membrane fusion protein, heavy metal efflux system
MRRIPLTALMKRIFESLSCRIVPCLAVTLLLGCHHHHADDHHHGEELGTAQITVWGERHEIFAEHLVVVANAPAKFVTHVTDLRTLQPRREGPIRFLLQLGDDPPVELTEKAPSRAGIYEAVLTFPKAGDWDIAVVIPAVEGEETIALPPVKVFPTMHDALHGEVPEHPDGISFLKEQQWKIGCAIEPVRTRTLTEQLRLPAVVSARPGSQAQVVTPMSGLLALPRGWAMPVVGDVVEAGQTLALIQPSFSEAGARFVEAEGEVVRAKLAFEQAELALGRVETLAKADARSQRELQEAEFALKIAQAKYEAALALQATYRQATGKTGGPGKGPGQNAVELRSPISGTITAQSGAAVGEYITGEKALFTLLDASTVFIEAQVPESAVNRLGPSKMASYEVPGEPGRFTPITSEGFGRLVFVGMRVDAATRTVPIVYEAKNADSRLRVGQSLNLYVQTARAEESLALPEEAIVDEAGRPVAFVQLAGETFEKRDLVLGIRDGNWVQVLEGLAEGERVVTRSAYAVRMASMSSAIPAHGHAH